MSSTASKISSNVRNILFPTDFSPASHNAFSYALDMAAHIGGRVLLFHSYYETPVAEGVAPQAFMTQLRTEKESHALEEFHRYELEARMRFGDQVDIIPLLESGRAYEQILKASHSENVDMIVMGTRGALSSAQQIFGSLTSRIIEAADCPVLAVPEGVNFQPIRHILYASNFEEADFAILDRLLDISDLFDAQLSCAHIYAGESYWARLDRSFFERLYHLEREQDRLQFFTFNHRDIVAGLHRFIAANKVDMLAMLTHKRDPMHQALDESITREMALHTEVPLLAFHAS